MRKVTLSIILILLITASFAQQKWFTLYTDSASMVKDGSEIVKLFTKDIEKIKPDIQLNVKTVLHTTPYLIYYDDKEKTANLPLWEQVIPEQKNFFYQIAGSETDGKRVFALFFNGFYLPHELGHAFQSAIQDSLHNSYANEYFANTIAILWWRKHKRGKELKMCYEDAKKIWMKLPNPVPKGMTIEEYFTKNYEKASQDPVTYGYMQFKQFIQIYEDQTLPDFDTFITKHLTQK
jgi:hypothetical protein